MSASAITRGYAGSMDFVTAVRTCFTKYATFDGRAGRPEFWWFALFTWLVSGIAGAFDGAISFGINPIWWGETPEFEFFQSVTQLALLLPSLAVATRRLRDAGKSFWNFLWVFLPVIGWIILIVKFASQSKPSTDNFQI